MRQYIFITTLFITSSLFSQTLERSVIGSSGTTLSNANASINFTVGELVTTTESNGTVTLNQGFHQEVIMLKIKLSPITFLQGPLVTSGTTVMDDSLRSNSLLPTTSPYTDGLTCETTVFDNTGSDAIIDWVWITLRDKNDQTIVIASQSALLQADGDIVATDGASALEFDLPSDSYYVAINHRNHLGILSAATIALNSVNTTTVNLSDTSIAAFGGSNSTIDMGNGIFAMISGDFDENGQIQNTDASSVIQLLGISGYNNADIDMNGQVQNLDINSILNTNIGKGEQF
ncbi:hemagglutinin protein [Tenacibaculum agarivorans]|uniref:hemagglutinin protein n=1 Tax=Tenacibaculum agarivorans TaxID=1908389 RepID=UPI000AA309FA|nr:hemagglutinin protein [Tenacibaculum agarivorans]